jgi:hypothetical protein
MGSGTTARLGLEYPLTSDPTNIPGDMQTLATQLATGISPSFAGSVVFLAGTASAIPAAGIAGRIYYASDTGTLNWDNGSVLTSRSTATLGVDWELPPSPITATLAEHDVAAGASYTLIGAEELTIGEAGTYFVSPSINVVSLSTTYNGSGNIGLLHNGTVIYSWSIRLTESGAGNDNITVGTPVPVPCAASDTLQLEYTSNTGSATIRFAYNAPNTYSSFSATWLHA